MKNKTMLISIIIISITIIISYIYTTFPRLQLNGKKNMIISYREEYQEPGVIVKNANNNYLSKVKIESNIDNKTIGNYYVDYSLNIKARQLHVRRNVKIIDDIAPVIKLKGDQIIQISINQEYEEPGYTAIDEYDGQLTDKVEIIGEVDTHNYGEYIIKYKVKDNSDNTVEVNRIVKVIDEISPKFECKTEYSAFKIESENIIGCKAIDNFDGDITDKVEVSGNYDINQKGIYKVQYSVEDDAGNKTTINHNIVIYEELEQPTAYLTFDDGPTKLTKNILEILKQQEIKATFFICPQNNEENYKYLNQALEEGHELGIHGYHNRDELYKDLDTFKNYFEKIQKLIYDKTEKKLTIYRFPGGSKSKYLSEEIFNQIKKYLDEQEITYYDWNIDSTDSSSLTITSKEITENTINQLLQNKNQETVILFHDTDTKQATIDSLPTIIEILKEMNYKFDTISQSKPIQFTN